MEVTLIPDNSLRGQATIDFLRLRVSLKELNSHTLKLQQYEVVDAAVSRLKDGINSAAESAFQFRPFLHQPSTIPDPILLRIMRKNRIQNRWYCSCDTALKTHHNRLQLSIKFALHDNENSGLNDSIEGPFQKRRMLRWERCLLSTAC